MNTLTIRKYWRVLLAAIALLAVAAVVLSRMVLAAQSPAWQRDGLPGVTIHAFAVSPHSSGASMVLAGTEDGVYRRDGAGTWKRLLRSEAVWNLDLLPDNRTVLAGDQSGKVYVSHDGGLHWRSSEITPNGVYAVTHQPGTETHFLAGADSGLYLSTDGGVHWLRTLALHHAGGSAFAWQPGSSRTVYAGVVATAADGPIGVYVSHDAGQHWRPFGAGLGSYGGIMSLAAPAGRLYAGTMGNLIWSIGGAGGTWRQLPNGLPPNNHVSGIALLPGHAQKAPDTLFISTLAAGVFRTNNGGSSWQSVSDGLPDTDGDRVVLNLAYAPRERVLYAATLDGVYRFANAQK